jgi:type IV secretory pathway TraG/TraD family ATPase VirD4
MEDEARQHTLRLGMRETWGGIEPFGLSPADRRQHLYVLGKTGTGKTTFLRNLILQDIEAGHGVGVIDPHGDLAVDLLDHIPRRRTDDVVYFHPADADMTVGLNLFKSVPPPRQHLVASGIVSALKSIWHTSWGPRLEYVLYAAIAALLECQNTSILGVQRMLVDSRYRSWVLNQVKDPMVQSFWNQEFAGYDKQLRAEIIAPIQNKVGQLLMAPPMRSVLGQIRPKIDARFMIDNRRIFIANLSKGELGADKSNLLGALLTTQFQLAAMSRTDVPESERRDFFLYVDEFHNFTTEAFTSILAEARKYRLCLTLCHQHSSQLPQETLDAVLGNVGSIVSFRVGDHDARLLEREFEGTYPSKVFSSLPNRHLIVKMLRDGEPLQPFQGAPDAPKSRRVGRRDNLIARSRQKYAVPKDIVEDKIRRWMERHH